MSRANIKNEDVIAANIELHSKLAKTYNQVEPHWRPENMKIVRERLEACQNKVGGNSMLDIGCGTGFMIEIAKPLKFQKITGIDITEEMMKHISVTGKTEIELVVGDVNQMPFANNTFDVATAYSVLDHLFDLPKVMKEVYRCLKPGGIFYCGLIPNEAFWTALKNLDPNKTYSAGMQRELAHITKLTSSPEGLKEKSDLYAVAEYQKHILGGLDEKKLSHILNIAGFQKIEFVYDWFLGQAVLNNDKTLSESERQNRMSIIDQYLREQLPLTCGFFKYFSFFATK